MESNLGKTCLICFRLSTDLRSTKIIYCVICSQGLPVRYNWVYNITRFVFILQHRGIPYCNIPCYSLLFGPGGYGRGGTESYQYFADDKLTPAELDAIRCSMYNYY